MDKWEEVNIERTNDDRYLVTMWVPIEGTAMSNRHDHSFETIDEVCRYLLEGEDEQKRKQS